MELAATLLPFVAIALIFWLLLIRPQQRRQRELLRMQQSLNVGDEVMLTSGVYGVLATLDDDTVTLEVAEGVRIKVARGAVANVVTAEEAPAEPPTTENPDEER